MDLASHLGGRYLPQPYFDNQHGMFGDQAEQALIAVCQMRTDSNFSIPSCLHVDQTPLDAGNDLSFSQSRCVVHQLFPSYAPNHLSRQMLRLDGIEWHLITAIEP